MPASQRVATVPGVYGLRLGGLNGSTLLAEVNVSAPRLDVSIEIGRVCDRTESFEDQTAEISLIDNGWISLRRSGQAHFVLASETPPDEILHPWLVPAAATFNGWHGRHVLHGGAFAREGAAVALLGEKEDGKSSVLAWLAAAGAADVLTDDLVVVQEQEVFSGPRCIDLRPGSAELLGRAEGRLVRSASRVRMILPPCPASALLSAIVVLEWGSGPEVKLHPLTAAQGIAALLPHALNAGGGDRLLELIGVPVWVLERPRNWASMDQVSETLLGLLPDTARQK
jgi:hypothetical protein